MAGWKEDVDTSQSATLDEKLDWFGKFETFKESITELTKGGFTSGELSCELEDDGVEYNYRGWWSIQEVPS